MPSSSSHYFSSRRANEQQAGSLTRSCRSAATTSTARTPAPPKRLGTLGTASLPAGRDAVLIVPLLFFAPRERTPSGLTHSLVPVRRDYINRPNAYAAETIRDVGDSVPPRWEGCRPHRPTTFLRAARTNTKRAHSLARAGAPRLHQPPERLRRRND